MIAPTTIAARIWANLPGDTLDKAHLLKLVMSELVAIRTVAVAEHRRAERVHAPHKLRPTAEMVAKIVGLPVGKTAPYRVCIHGINTSVADVFAIAAKPGHPLQPECQAFLTDNRLSLVEGRKNADKHGRKRQIVTQAPLEPTPAQILEKTRAVIGGVLERCATAYITSESNARITDTGTCTDHSGGIVTDFPADAIVRHPLERRSDEAGE